MSKIIKRKIKKGERLDLVISTSIVPLLFIIIFSSIFLIATAQIGGAQEYTISTNYPDAEFSANKTWGKSPLTVQFTDESTENPTEWKWNFGDGSDIIDGTTSDFQNPTHTYEKAGVYTVTETAINSVGRSTDLKIINITVKDPILEEIDAEFSASPTSGEAPLKVTFTDESSGSPTKWEWDFGDGNTSSDRSPSNTYSKEETYTVTLTVSDGVTSDRQVKKSYITVDEPEVPVVVANFYSNKTSGKVPLTVKFTDTSNGGPTSLEWDFGDGDTSTSKDPVYTYSTPGTYSVTLTATNGTVSDDITKSDYITAEVNGPTASFIASKTEGVAPLTVKFTDTSIGSPTKWTWDFGDGNTSTNQNPSHIYYGAETYAVELTVRNEVDKDTETKIDYINVTSPDDDDKEKPNNSTDGSNSSTGLPGENRGHNNSEPNNTTGKSQPFDSDTVIPIVVAIIGLISAITVAYIQRKNK